MKKEKAWQFGSFARGRNRRLSEGHPTVRLNMRSPFLPNSSRAYLVAAWADEKHQAVKHDEVARQENEVIIKLLRLRGASTAETKQAAA